MPTWQRTFAGGKYGFYEFTQMPILRIKLIHINTKKAKHQSCSSVKFESDKNYGKINGKRYGKLITVKKTSLLIVLVFFEKLRYGEAGGRNSVFLMRICFGANTSFLNNI